jgi:CheY-like chemotaxis protein
MPAIEKILLIDDDPDEHRLLKDAVHSIRREIECDFANGPTQAFLFLETTKGRLPDMIFLDVNMSPYSGPDCLKALKASETFSAIPVIMYTVADLGGDKATYRRLGASFFLQKRLTKDLVLALRYLFGEHLPEDDLKQISALLVKLI